MIRTGRTITLTVAIRTMTVIVRWTPTQRVIMFFLLKLTCRLQLAHVMQCHVNILCHHDVTLNNRVSCVAMSFPVVHRRSQGGQTGHAPQIFGIYSHFVL